ncbi:MAG: DUF190 domain-containing protein [Chloroflexaceae bacterium]|nr:DUF190 domain-containing protein [Chloroflexaceae bacterium]
MIQRVCIYVSERDMWNQQPLYLAVLERLRQEGATGATVLQGVAGFGPATGCGLPVWATVAKVCPW